MRLDRPPLTESTTACRGDGGLKRLRQAGPAPASMTMNYRAFRIPCGRRRLPAVVATCAASSSNWRACLPRPGTSRQRPVEQAFGRSRQVQPLSRRRRATHQRVLAGAESTGRTTTAVLEPPPPPTTIVLRFSTTAAAHTPADAVLTFPTSAGPGDDLAPVGGRPAAIHSRGEPSQGNGLLASNDRSERERQPASSPSPCNDGRRRRR